MVKYFSFFVILVSFSISHLCAQSFSAQFTLCSHKFYDKAKLFTPLYLNSMDFRLENPSGTSVTNVKRKQYSIFSAEDLVMSSPTINDAINAMKKELEPQLLNVLNEFHNGLATFDIANFQTAENIQVMRLDSSMAAKIPKVFQSYKKSVIEYKKLEKLSTDFFNYSHQPSIPMVGMSKKVNEFLSNQNNIVKAGNHFYFQGKEILNYSQNMNQISMQSKKINNKENTLSNLDKRKLVKIKSDIKFAQNQVKKLMKSKTELNDVSESIRSEVLIYTGTIAIAMKQTTELIESTLSAITKNSGVLTGVDISKAFLEKLMEENIANGIPLEKAIKTAYEAAYYKAVVAALSSEKFPIQELSVIPLKIKGIIDNAEKWKELNENQTVLNRTINEHYRFIDYAIKLNERIILKSNLEAEKIIKSESRKFLKNPLLDK